VSLWHGGVSWASAVELTATIWIYPSVAAGNPRPVAGHGRGRGRPATAVGAV